MDRVGSPMRRAVNEDNGKGALSQKIGVNSEKGGGKIRNRDSC